MYIVKNLKDYKLSEKQKIFDAIICNEKITNRAAMRKYLLRDNDFVIYSTAVADPALLVPRYKAG